MPFTLDDSPDKTGLAVVGGDAERRLPPARPPLILTFGSAASRTILRSKHKLFTGYSSARVEGLLKE
ncbi:hypothetical protein, partial [Escherichia coli]|uniref:hypothetical protein n=1 Tax=Escherichia coli TaxID=562 RepID=UPI0022F14111